MLCIITFTTKKQQRKKCWKDLGFILHCWNVEDLEGEHPVTELLKVQRRLGGPYFDDVIDAGWEGNIPAVEVSFGNACNFKCTYCSPYTVASGNKK